MAADPGHPLADATVALLVEAAGRIHVGSGLLVALENPERVVVATAAHNLDGAAGPRAVRVVPRGRYFADPLRVLALGLPPSGGPDLAWLEVEACEVRQRCLAPVSLASLGALSGRYVREDPGGTLTVYGFPAWRVPWSSLGGTRFELAPAILEACVVACGEHPDELAVSWSDAGDGFHPRGLSGCGIWTLAGGVPTPVALARSWHGGRRMLYCTPIAGWVDWIGDTESRASRGGTHVWT